MELIGTETGWVDYFPREERKHKQVYSEWRGNGLKDFLLKDGEEVKKSDFELLLQGYNPVIPEDYREPLIKLRKSAITGKARGGFDITFKAPKSYSIAALLYEDSNLIDIHRASCIATLLYIEEELLRVKYKGQLTETQIGIQALFQHCLSRKYDPLLHTHSIVLNLAKRPDDKWSGAQFYPIFIEQKKIINRYRSSLRRLSEAAGYRTYEGKHCFELCGINREQILEFSSRTKDILNFLAERGAKCTSGSRQWATFVTRPDKDLEVHIDTLKNDWMDRALQVGLPNSLGELLERNGFRNNNPQRIVREQIENIERSRGVKI